MSEQTSETVKETNLFGLVDYDEIKLNLTALENALTLEIINGRFENNVTLHAFMQEKRRQFNEVSAWMSEFRMFFDGRLSEEAMTRYVREHVVDKQDV